MLARFLTREGEEIPRGFGIAYRDFTRDVVVCYPLGLNVLVAYWQELRRQLQVPEAYKRQEYWAHARVEQLLRDYKMSYVEEQLLDHMERTKRRMRGELARTAYLLGERT